jgi:hypothetical protein
MDFVLTGFLELLIPCIIYVMLASRVVELEASLYMVNCMAILLFPIFL